MTNLPALPIPLSAENASAQLLLRVVNDSQNGKPNNLQIERSTSGEWILSASSELKAETLGWAIELLRETPQFLAPGLEVEISAAIFELRAATARPAWMDDGDAIAHEAALTKACRDYPIDVVESACEAWRRVPQHGKWWPTEQDLREQCESIFRPRKSLYNKARLLLGEIEKREKEANRPASVFPGSRGANFREVMRKRLSPARYAAYFEPSHIHFQGDDVILVRSQTAERVLRKEGGDALASMGIEVRYEPRFFKMREPTWEDDTPEERAEVTRKFNRLKEALRKGENLTALRASGEI